MRVLVLDFPKEACSIEGVVQEHPKLIFSISMLRFCGKIIDVEETSRIGIYRQIPMEPGTGGYWYWWKDWIKLVNENSLIVSEKLSRFRFIFG